MNTPPDSALPDGGNQKLTEGFIPRTDLATAAIVDEGLAMLDNHGLECAAAFLSSRMVPLAVARRALLLPPERRGSVSTDPEQK
ncbi:MAG: hypothetical protein JWR22_2932 [Herminiimonas sp.]|nr:hypothetical protein [Herminiimonas sp.]